jgi:putative tryptophan/tyrosine transport system substrate-binding protein
MTGCRTVVLAGVVMLLAAAMPAAAQLAGPQKPVHIGFLSIANTEQSHGFAAFRLALRDLGYSEGRNVILDTRFARGDYAAMPKLAAELAALPADIIVTEGGDDVARIAVAATTTIPIVMATSGDPVGAGLVKSLARPGGNLTGFTLETPGINAKRLDLLRSALPWMSAVTVLLNPENGSTAWRWRETQAAAQILGLAVTPVEAASVDALRALRPDAFDRATPVVILPDGMFGNNRQDIIALFTAARVPAIYPQREYAELGGLIAYGTNVPDNFRRAAEYVDRILRGDKPADLPVQEPVRFDFVVNLRSARLLGIQLSPHFIASADEVIE